MSITLDRPKSHHDRLATEDLRRAERLLIRERPIGLKDYRNKILYICAAGALSLSLSAWGVSLIALGRNNTEDLRVFSAALVLFGIVGCVASFVVAVLVGYRAFQSQYGTAAMRIEDVLIAHDEALAVFRTLDELRHDAEFERQIRCCLRQSLPGMSISSYQKNQDKIAEGLISIVEKRMRDKLPEDFCPA